MKKAGNGKTNFRLIIVSTLAMCLSVVAVSAYIFTAVEHTLILTLALTISLVSAFAGALVIFNSVRMSSMIKRQQLHYADAENHYFNVLCEVMMVVEARDKYLAGRSRRMASLVAQVASHMKLDKQYSHLLGMIARVHDIGLLSVPAEVMSKAGSLTANEFNIIKRHCRIGCHILQQLNFLSPVLDAVLYHHERMNGTGYPEGLKGEDIPIGARILAVVDSFDAMTHDRPHRHALSPAQAVDELVRCTGPGYDKEVVIALAAVQKMTEQLPAEWLGVTEQTQEV